jgi:hypothetical protein
MHGSHGSHFSFASIALLTHRVPGVWQIFIYRGGAPTFRFALVVPWAKAGPDFNAIKMKVSTSMAKELQGESFFSLSLFSFFPT